MTNHCTSGRCNLKLSQTTREMRIPDGCPKGWVYLKPSVLPDTRTDGRFSPSPSPSSTGFSSQTNPRISSGLHHSLINSRLFSHSCDAPAIPNTILCNASPLLSLLDCSPRAAATAGWKLLTLPTASDDEDADDDCEGKATEGNTDPVCRETNIGAATHDELLPRVEKSNICQALIPTATTAMSNNTVLHKRRRGPEPRIWLLMNILYTSRLS